VATAYGVVHAPTTVARNGGSRLRLIRPTRPRVRRWADIVDRLSAMFGRAAGRNRPETSGDYLRQIRRRSGWRRVEARPTVGLQRLQALRELFDDRVPLSVRVAPPVEDLGQGTSAADTRFRRRNECARSDARGSSGHHLIGSVLHVACLTRFAGRAELSAAIGRRHSKPPTAPESLRRRRATRARFQTIVNLARTPWVIRYETSLR
jgi:hypothetical protein